MAEKTQWIIRREDLDRYSEAIQRDNRTAFRLMTVSGCILSVFNLVTQIVITGFGMPLFRSSILLACFSLLLFLDRAIIPEDRPLSTGALYLAQAPVLLFSVLLGTIWDRDHQATTILLFMTAFSMFADWATGDGRNFNFAELLFWRSAATCIGALLMFLYGKFSHSEVTV